MRLKMLVMNSDLDKEKDSLLIISMQEHPEHGHRTRSFLLDR